MARSSLIINRAPDVLAPDKDVKTAKTLGDAALKELDQAHAHQMRFGKLVLDVAQAILDYTPKVRIPAVDTARALAIGAVGKAGSLSTALADRHGKAGTSLKKAQLALLTPTVSSEQLATSSKATADASGEFRAIGAEVHKGAEQLVGQLMELARLGYRTENTEFATKIGGFADRAQDIANLPPINAMDLVIREAKTAYDKAAERAEQGFEFSDFLNTIAGLVSSIAGLAGATIGGLIGNALFTCFGMFFDSVGLILGIIAAVTAGATAKRLQKLIPTLSGGEAKEIAQYAKQQMTTKKRRGAVLSTVSGVSLLAGATGLTAFPAVAAAFGLAAASLATLGVVGAVIGLVTAAIGLGVIFWKWRHRKAKEKRAVTLLLETQKNLADTGDAAAKALMAKSPKEQRAWAKTQIQNKRTQVASTLVKLLSAGKPSEQLDSERIVAALKLKPDKLRALVKDNKGGTAVDEVADKLKSW